MRTIIDGYNLMYAKGLLGRQLGAEGFRKTRHRFLNDLAAALGPVEAHRTTVVFDASRPPHDLPRETSHKGLTVVFAVDDESADARIEWLIAHHAAPRTLTVVSSDHRVRQAASRRKAQALTSEEFLDRLEAGKRKAANPPPRRTDEERAREHGLSPEEAAYWQRQFADLEQAPETQEVMRHEPVFLTDEEIAQLQREIDEEP